MCGIAGYIGDLSIDTLEKMLKGFLIEAQMITVYGEMRVMGSVWLIVDCQLLISPLLVNNL